MNQPDDRIYRLLVDAIDDYAVYMLDPDGLVMTWNSGAERVTGSAAADVLGQHFERFHTAADRAAGHPLESLRAARDEGRHEEEGWRVREDGSTFWTHVVTDAVRDEQGALIGYVKIARDLTEQRRHEQLNQRTEQQFRLLVQGVADYAIYMLDRDGNVSSWNAGAQRIKGYTPSEIIGKHLGTFYTEADRLAGEPLRGLSIARETGRFENEARRVRKDGSQFWAHIVIDRIHDEAGQFIGFAKITRDITAKKEADEALAAAREALFQSQKLEAIGQLTGGVAHDFNNLLMAVLGSLELLKPRLGSDAASQALLNNAIAGAERGAALTQHMLAFARRQELLPAPVDPRDTVQGMTALLRRSIGPLISIETTFPLDLPSVLVDKNQLELALLNLAVNARDAMPNGGYLGIAARAHTLSDSHRTGLPAGAYVSISVSDQGAGMDAQTLARATEPFFTTKGVGKGTGLGLSMVHGLAEQSGGRLIMRSTLGEGTTAELWLPQATSHMAQVVQQELEDVPPGLPQMGALRILAVDDDPLIRLTMSMLLQDLGHQVQEVASAAEAMRSLSASQDVDVVITDQAMPGMTGLQLAEAIRQQWPEIPVILATGYAELPDEARQLTVTRLSKPYGQAELVAALGKARALASI